MFRGIMTWWWQLPRQLFTYRFILMFTIVAFCVASECIIHFLFVIVSMAVISDHVPVETVLIAMIGEYDPFVCVLMAVIGGYNLGVIVLMAVIGGYNLVVIILMDVIGGYNQDVTALFTDWWIRPSCICFGSCDWIYDSFVIVLMLQLADTTQLPLS